MLSCPRATRRREAKLWKLGTAGARSRRVLRASKDLGRALWLNWRGCEWQRSDPRSGPQPLYGTRHLDDRGREVSVLDERGSAIAG